MWTDGGAGISVSGDGAEGAPAAGEGAAGADGGDAPSLEKLASAFEQFQTGVTSTLDGFAQRLPEPAPKEEPAPDDPEFDLAAFEAQFTDDDFDAEGNVSQEAQMRALATMMQNTAREAAQAAVNPMLERQAEERRDAEADALEERYPELQDEKVQDAMIQRVAAFAHALGNPALAQEPKLLEIVYLAEKGQKAAGEEIPAGQTQGVSLERGGSAGPADAADDESMGDRLVATAQKSRFRLG